MSSDIVLWGLTKTDFRDCWTNDTYAGATCLAAAFIAGAVAFVALRLMTENDADGPSLKNKIISVGIGAVAGIAAGIVIAHQFIPITFDEDKVVKFVILTIATIPTGVLPLFTAGGVWSAFGRFPLYYVTVFSALSGALYTGMRK